MLTPFSVDEVNLKIQRTRYKVSTKCGEDKTFYRFGFNGQEKDEEIKGRGNINTAEFWQYDTRTGRRWNLDPKPTAGVSQYSVLLNSPLWINDVLGDSVSIIISGPTLSNNSTKSYSNGLAGHVAINIDGNVYSFEGNGQWKLYEKDKKYTQSEKKQRWVVEITVKVDQKKVEEFLKKEMEEQNNRLNDGDKSNDNQYNLVDNSCVSNTMDALTEGGIKLNKPNGAVTPEQLAETLVDNKNKTTVKMDRPNFDKSFTGRLIYSITKLLGVQEKLAGAKLNTNELNKEKDKTTNNKAP